MTTCSRQRKIPPTSTRSIWPRRKSRALSGGINTYGSWSPDMKHIAFRKIIGDENSEVFVADGNGSNPRNRTKNAFFDGWPAWPRLPDFRHGRGWRQPASGCEYRRPRNSAAMVSRRQSDLLYKLRCERL